MQEKDEELGNTAPLSAPLRPTSNTISSVTDSGLVAPLRPTSVTTVVVTSTSGVPAGQLPARSASTYILLCGGPDADTFTWSAVCDGAPDYLVPTNGQYCEAFCQCNEHGKMHCPSPATGCSDNGKVTALCALGEDYVCECHKQPDEDTKVIEEAKSSVSPALAALELKRAEDSAAPSVFCWDSSLTKTDIAGTCMDGNFLMYSGDDCQHYCKCDGSGKLTCSHPSDCGPDNVVNYYCKKNGNFQCDCLTSKVALMKAIGLDEDSSDNIAMALSEALTSNQYDEMANELQHDSGSTVTYPKHTTFATLTVPNSAAVSTMDRQQRSAASDFALTCEGPNMLHTFPMPPCENRRQEVHGNGYYCQAHCWCNDDGCVTCDALGQPSGIETCRGNDKATSFCGAPHDDYFSCYCLNKHGAKSACN